ncbi:hypothetical protein EI94DRAFT_1737017, partial [Lactarius quietus]
MSVHDFMSASITASSYYYFLEFWSSYVETFFFLQYCVSFSQTRIAMITVCVAVAAALIVM